MTGVAVARAVAAGLAGAVQAAVMGELGGRVGVFPALAFSGVVSVVLGVALLLLGSRGPAPSDWSSSAPVQRSHSSRPNCSDRVDYIHGLVSDTVTGV